VVAISGSSYDFGAVGTSLITAKFTPTNTTNYVSGGTVTMTVTVDKATPTLGELSAMSKTFGDSTFSPTNPTAQLNGADVAGTWSYASGTAGTATALGTTITIQGAGASTITATFSPTDTANFTTATTTAILTVGQATPTFTWSGVTATYGGSNSTIVAPTVATTAATGTWSYASATTSVVTVTGSEFDFGDAGSSVITATFTPSNTTNYVSGGTVTMTVNVGKAGQSTLTVASTNGTYGAPLPLTTTGGTTSGVVTWLAANDTATGCAVSSCSLTTTSAGTCTLTATMAGNDNYNAVSSSATTVTLATRAITIAADAQTKERRTLERSLNR
jgi:hypothetical protein